MTQEKKKRTVRFSDLGLSKEIVQILDRLKFVTPTPIQEKAIPLALEGKDVIGIAQTGTGKTLSFFLPMLENLKDRKHRGLIIVPTRELALQAKQEIDKVGQRLGFKTTLIVGGAKMHLQLKSLKRNPDVIVATPGRLNDHLERKTVHLHKVSTLVLDEADRMLDMGFAPQINRILESVPDKRQTLLFSATMPDAIAKMAHEYMNNPVRVEIARAGESSKNITQGMYFVKKENRFALLEYLLKKFNEGPVLVFCRTKHGTKKMARILNRDGYRAEELHSNRTLNQRTKALKKFKTGESRVMVATDVAARGIDVKEISLVVNYDIPDQKEDYVHRIGRTGRASHEGHAISFVMPDQYKDMLAIQKLIGKKVELLEGPGSMTAEEVILLGKRSQKSSGGRRRRGSSDRSRRKKRPGTVPRRSGGNARSRQKKHYKSRSRKREKVA